MCECLCALLLTSPESPASELQSDGKHSETKADETEKQWKGEVGGVWNGGGGIVGSGVSF